MIQIAQNERPIGRGYIFNSKEIYSIKGFDTVRKAKNYAKKYGYAIFEKLPDGVKDFEYCN